MSRCDPQIEIYRASQNDHNNFLKISKTDVAENTQNPRFDAMKFKGNQLCNCDYELPILFQAVNTAN